EIGGAVQMHAIASVAPPRLPFDGDATPLAQRYAEQLRAARDSGQRSLGFETPRDWVREVRREIRVAEQRAQVGPAVADSPGLVAAMSRAPHVEDADWLQTSQTLAAAAQAALDALAPPTRERVAIPTLAAEPEPAVLEVPRAAGSGPVAGFFAS